MVTSEQFRHIVYALSDPRTEQTRYIGQTRNPDERFRKHRLAQTHGILKEWERELRDAGLEPNVRILEEDILPDQIDEREIYWIARGGIEGWPLLNIMAGGNGWNWREVPEWVREKISKSMGERWQDPEFHDKQVRKMTEALADPEVRAKMSEAAKGRVLDEETRAKISNTVTELWEDPDYREHQSRVHKRAAIEMWEDPEFREKHGAGTCSDETRTKISDASKRMWQDPETRSRLVEERRSRGSLSEEHKQKIAEGVKRNWLKRQGKQSMDQP